MKKIIYFFAICLVGVISIFAGCKQEDGSKTISEDLKTIPEVYKNFYNYPDGRKNANGTLTLKNKVSSSVLVFTDSVEDKNYIGTIPALGSITVKLDIGPHHIVTVYESVYKEKPQEAKQSSQFVYYSGIQGYTINVSAENLTGSGTWIFNNTTDYWAFIEDVSSDNKEPYAVIAPKTQRVKVPVQTNKPYDYKITYKKELKLNGVTIAVSEISRQEQNDTAVFKSTNNFTVTTDLKLSSNPTDDNLDPSVQLINSSGKSVRVYNGNIQVSSFGALDSEDYVCLDGETAIFTGFTANSNATTVHIRSNAWTDAIACTEDAKFEKGKVYVITITKNTSTETGASPVLWAVEEKPAGEFYSDK